MSDALAALLGAVTPVLGPRLASVLLYGSVVLDDLAPGYGDLDFLAAVRDDLSDDDIGRLIAVRQSLRRPESGPYCHMLEGAFLPRRMLDPSQAGRALWWGTSSERPWTENRLGWLVIEFIRQQGLCIYGEDIRGEIPAAAPEALRQDIAAFCASAREHGAAGGLHSIDWLLTAARELLLLREGRFSSKSEAADWGAANAKGRWRGWLPRARALRKNPGEAANPDTMMWLESLSAPIEEAIQELETELEDSVGSQMRD